MFSVCFFNSLKRQAIERSPHLSININSSFLRLPRLKSSPPTPVSVAACRLTSGSALLSSPKPKFSPQKTLRHHAYNHGHASCLARFSHPLSEPTLGSDYPK
jgi:hypothetical protein